MKDRRKIQTLQQEDFSLDIIQDLGIIFANKLMKTKARYAIFKCRCGEEFVNQVTMVKTKRITKCNKCVNAERARQKTKHGYHNHPLLKAIRGIMFRCYNENAHNYYLYGAKGVTVCDEWKNSEIAFIEWSLVNGWEKGLQIDKDILSKKLGISPAIYSPQTCQWVTVRLNQNDSHDRAVNQFSLDGVFIERFNSIADALEHFGFNRKSGSIGNQIAGRSKSACGFKWEYAK